MYREYSSTGILDRPEQKAKASTRWRFLSVRDGVSDDIYPENSALEADQPTFLSASGIRDGCGL